MDNIKVLLAAPTFDGMRYCQEEFYSAVKELEGDYDILIVDNSRGSSYTEEIKDLLGEKGVVIHDPTAEEKSIFRLISSRNLVLNYALENGYSHVLMLDSDVIPPRDIISKLLSCDKSIVSGLYYNYFMVNRIKKWLPVSWKLLTEEEFFELKKVPSYANISRGDVRRHITDEEVSSGVLQEVVMPSAGCMLISREVFSKIRYGRFSDVGGADDDRFFIDMAIKSGFFPFCLPSVICQHLVKDKYSSDGEGNLIHKSFNDLI